MECPCLGAEVSVFTVGLCVLCSERCCHSAVCKLCCVRNWGIGWGSNMVRCMLNCKWCSVGYCDILSDHCLFCCTIWPFSSLSFILHASAHFCTATVEAIEAEKGTIRVLTLGRDLWCGRASERSCGCVLLLACTAQDESDSLTHRVEVTFLFFLNHKDWFHSDKLVFPLVYYSIICN